MSALHGFKLARFFKGIRATKIFESGRDCPISLLSFPTAATRFGDRFISSMRPSSLKNCVRVLALIEEAKTVSRLSASQPSGLRMPSRHSVQVSLLPYNHGSRSRHTCPEDCATSLFSHLALYRGCEEGDYVLREPFAPLFC